MLDRLIGLRVRDVGCDKHSFYIKDVVILDFGTLT